MIEVTKFRRKTQTSREKERDLTQFYDKNITQKREQKFDYTAIADRLRTTAIQLVWLIG